MQTPQVKEKLVFEDMEFSEMDPEKFNLFMQKEINNWGPL
jgi:hypothetical protein